MGEGGNVGSPEGVSWDPHTPFIRPVGFFTVCLNPTFLQRRDYVFYSTSFFCDTVSGGGKERGIEKRMEG